MAFSFNNICGNHSRLDAVVTEWAGIRNGLVRVSNLVNVHVHSNSLSLRNT